jgi:alcohol dehydrogenase class IV
MPAVVTADTGIDALVHAMESYVSTYGGPFSDIFAIEAVRIISENLPKAFCKGSDLDARTKMALGSCMTGLAFTSSSVGAVHALSYPLDSEFGISHGRSQGAILPYIIEFNRAGNAKKYAEIAKAVGERIDHLSNFEATEKLLQTIFKLLDLLGISTRLKDYGIAEKDIDTLVDGAMKQSRLFGPNPRDMGENDVRNIYLRAFNH